MSIDTDQKKRRSSARERSERRRKKQNQGRDHARRLIPVEAESADAASSAESDVRRMQPRSHVRPASTVSVSERRAERKARKIHVQGQVQRATERTRRRRVSIRGVFSWRTVSGLLVIGLMGVLYLFLTMDAFFVSAVAIGGEKYLTREEIFRFSDVAQQHIFWIDPAHVEARLESVPNIAEAVVYVGWPPDMLQIVVVEREPALIWEQGIRVWVDVNGIVMTQREDRTDLLRIVVRDAEDPISVGERIPQSIVDGALYLHKRQNISVLLYNPEKGLGHLNPSGWTVWFGTGEDMDTKLLVYNELVAEIRGVLQPGEIFMNDPDRPYYTVLWYEGN
ncbi:MAG: FtsQ-type POTRA domain-containing protein [Anaerolineae bacterium]|nr:FtsQ-type POTRA domain-containing protein [Anaerolineae bacterium]